MKEGGCRKAVPFFSSAKENQGCMLRSKKEIAIPPDIYYFVILKLNFL